MALTPETVVTGDAVVLDVDIAQLPVRAVSALIDLIVVGSLYIAAVLLWAAALPRFDDAFNGAVLVIFTVVVLVGYPLGIEMATRGQSLGKMAMGLRVVSYDGGPERFRQALFRALAGFVEVWIMVGGPAIIASLLSAKGKRLGDMFAGTVVISERGPKPNPTPLMPPWLAWWAESLDLSGLEPQQAEMARQVLARARELTPAIRDEMGRRLAAQVSSCIAPPPPPGVSPQQVLAAVLAERHRRELARLRPRAEASQPPAAAYPAPPPPFAPRDGGFTPPG
jgi:uncharacterized RDD family membrane protein YckC